MAHVVPELLHRAWQTPAGGDLIISSPDHTRTFCYVSDAVELITRLALAPEAAGRTFNVGADLEDISIMELANLIAATVGKPLRIVPGQNHDGSTKRRRPDLKQTIAATAYRPAVTLAEGIEATCRWYQTMLTAGGPIADVPDQEPAP
jgi:nucleoside-diphosphate-sugar epimerase